MKYAPEFDETNKEVLEDYARSLGLNNFKETTINTKLWKVYTFLKHHDNKKINEITKKDIESYILFRRKNNKPKTVHNDIVDLRLFFKWLKPDNTFFEDIKTRTPKNHLPTKEIIVPADVKKLIPACKTQRDRAIIMTLWDSAARATEVLNLNIGHVEIDKYGAVIVVEGKTGMRRIRLIEAVPDLQAWINQHPYKNNPESPLFVTFRNTGNEPKRLDIRTVQNTLKKVAEDAGIKKNIHPHAFRHGKLTDLVKRGFKETELRIIAGWEADSKMPATYIHLSGDDVEKKLLASYGIIEDEIKKEKLELKPIECPRCKTLNPHDSKYCSSCSMVLDIKTAVKLDTEIKTTDGKLTQLMESKIDELVEARINEILKGISLGQ
ncbi:site-specific integrase [Methanococcoides burtonii]|uniref:Phage integrase domain protein n=1 Tax=Methanococcoides burtonii (strain DSM 6242 / NBRC 107633 / OCM 468 / ACE-M) TaxID=259564 RepID=Q12TQ2_METBU|nr:site-specific integrase [Methanococcoides burtonii]ABE53174.1 Phage integrase domain protein [Methanococcoides burtonii DSM 6242]